MEIRGTILMKKYELGRQLGQGNFAKVCYARSLETGQSVAVKIFDKERMLRLGLAEQIKREIRAMRLARHPNIVELYEVMASKTKIYFVLEYAKGGELFDKIARGRFKEDIARRYFHQLISALDYCHSRGVYHRDLKPENLLLDEHENLKISDFGLSALVDCKRKNALFQTTCGTPAYVAPEVIKGLEYDGAKADIWSCGVILFVFLAGYNPFYDQHVMTIYSKVTKCEYKFPGWFSYDAKKLIPNMLDLNPSSRISIAEIRNHKWFKKGLADKNLPAKKESKEQPTLDVTAASNLDSNTSEEKQKPTNIAQLTAFHIISHSAGFDLSNLFEDSDNVKQARFTAMKPASVIISKLEELAKSLMLKVIKKEGGLLRMEGPKEGRKSALAIDAEIFQVTPLVHLVEIKKSKGDTLEYQDMLNKDIRPALNDIVWVWQR